MLLLGLGIGMIASGIGIGARNIYTAGKEKGMENTELMAKQIQTQKAHINELIESEFKLNKLMTNMNKTLDDTIKTAEDAVIICNAVMEKKKSHVQNIVSEVVDTAKDVKDDIKTEVETLPDEITADDMPQFVEAKMPENENEVIAVAAAEEQLADAIVDAGVTEDEKLAQLCAEAIREEEEAASAKRYKAAKKGGKK